MGVFFFFSRLSHFCRLPQRQGRLVTQALHPCDILGRERARPVRADHDHRGRAEHGQHQHRLAVFREVVELDLPREGLRAATDSGASKTKTNQGCGGNVRRARVTWQAQHG